MIVIITAVYSHPNNGFPMDKMYANDKLCVGGEYEVDRVVVGRDFTKIYIHNIEAPFNSVLFDFYENGMEIDVTTRKEFWWHGLLG